MSSLFGDDGVEDLFNEQLDHNELPSGDEANEAENDDGLAEQDQPTVKVEPKKRVHRSRQRLTLDTLTGPRGIHTIEHYFKDIKFKGKGYEKQDLDEVLRRLQHWGHRMYPNYKFDDILTHIERLGKKKSLHVHMSRYRLGLLEDLHNNQLTNGDIMDEDEAAAVEEEEPFDEFDALLNEQIAISRLAPKTPASNSRQANTPSTLATPSFNRGNVAMSTPFSGKYQLDTSDLAQPLPPSQPATPQPTSKQLSSDQLALIAENRRKAQERLHAKKVHQESQQNTVDETLVDNS